MTAYANLLGTQLSELPPACQALHRNYGSWAGTITVETTRAPVLRTLLRLSGLPKAVQNAPFRFTSERDKDHDIWTRQIGDHITVSRLWADDSGQLCEQLGPMRATSQVQANATGIQLKIQRMWLLRLPLPAWLAPKVSTRESQVDGQYHFDVMIRVPITGGPLVRYHGHIETL
ncbi:hypothetical protein ATO10_13689 [Actibacterium atlanticum]|uniref:DUF4166 domain-containing protein n=1 Tax=Actibacterium atlanticum TaxID=1461693 RepID=A0A058ZJ96_9RHOB|nr:DUF4166 domain-containing protein [Actibacterium atlanticum]KCV81237.1 hypothetical protein ATO10_13689 [Actibacterium atlanticum]